MIIAFLVGALMTYLLNSIDNYFAFKTWFKENWNYLVIFLISIVVLILLFPANRIEYEALGVRKYLDKEIVIDQTKITYDSQNQPIDTTYTFKYNK